MNLPGPIHDFLLVFLGLGFILKRPWVILLTNFFFCFDVILTFPRLITNNMLKDSKLNDDK